MVTSRQITDFLMHLRWHYQLFILSGGYLMGGLFSGVTDTVMFLIQFANVHLLLFAGATAFNSWYDRDTGPVGGLRNPPKMQPWMLPASWVLQVAGAGIALLAGWTFFLLYLLSMLFFWLYSAPGPRWKGHPLRSLAAIGISTGTGSFLMGFTASGHEFIPLHVIAASLGVALVILSHYPLSQIYQMQDDLKRGDQTFSLRYGLAGVRRFFAGTFFPGLLILALALGYEGQRTIALLLPAAGMPAGVLIAVFLSRLTGSREEYFTVMRIKYFTSLLFVIFILLCFVIF
ncbi:MAG: UbiA family prenyltransferase [Rhodothermaceae bacterium]|nr:UbiA family prenyltransferase [Rhodothermaceae bacterium]